MVVVELSIFTIGCPIGIDSLRRKDLRLLPLGQDWILFVQASWYGGDFWRRLLSSSFPVSKRRLDGTDDDDIDGIVS